MGNNIIISEKARLSDVRWINTPFAFVQLKKDVTLLQLQVLMKISEQLQEYMHIFFQSGRDKLPDNPLSLFPAVMESLPVIKIPYKDFKITTNNRFELYKAIEKVLDLRIRIVYIDKTENVLKIEWINVFSKASTVVDYANISEKEYRNGNLELKINPDVAEYALNMRLGYINHPRALAEDSNQEHAPMLYFVIKHRLRPRRLEVTIPYRELRDELGMDEKVKLHPKKSGSIHRSNTTDFSGTRIQLPVPDMRREDEDMYLSSVVAEYEQNITAHHYEQFYLFKNKVLDPAISDINRLSDLNLLDIKVQYIVNYPPGVKRGDPISITFKVSLSKLGEFHKNPKAALAHMEISPVSVTSATVEPPKRKRGRPRKNPLPDDSAQGMLNFDGGGESPQPVILEGDKSDLWQQFVAEMNLPCITELTYKGTRDGGFYATSPLSSVAEFFVSGLGINNAIRYNDLLAKYLPDVPEQKRIYIEYGIL